MKAKGLIGIVLILAYFIIGECISYLIDNFVPGNVIGMVLLFASLQFGLIKEAWVSNVATFLTKNMAILFLPPAMGLLAIYTCLGENIVTIVLATLLSAMLVLAVVGLMQNKLGNDDERNN